MGRTQVEMKCSCGSGTFEIPRDPRPSDIIRCARCGAVGSYAEVMRKATSLAGKAVEKQLRDALRKAGFK